MNNLLISEEPLLVLPRLAEKIGLNEAIFLQQVHYWLNHSEHNYDGRKWIFNSVTEWKKQFPFFSENTIRRTIKNLEIKELLLVGNYNKAKFDKTKWYTINYEAMHLLESTNLLPKMSKRITQNEQLAIPKMGKPIPEITTEITTEKKDIVIPYSEITAYLNGKLSTNFKADAEANRRFIKARWNEGYRLEHFQKVIDIKHAEWINTDMQKYLRPATLFGPKFENYLNQVQGGKRDATTGKSITGSSKKESIISAETKRLDEIARRKGLMQNGEIRDINCEF